MLKDLDPLLNAELLFVLRSMGHGDRLVIADTNFPSHSIAKQTSHACLARIDAPAPRVVRAILSVMPLDSFIDDAAMRMEVVGNPSENPKVQAEVQREIDAAEGKHWPLKGIERFAFYESAKSAYAVVQTAERRFYGCFILTKGVIPPDDLSLVS